MRAADRPGGAAGADPGPVRAAHLPPGARRPDGPARLRRAGRHRDGQRPLGEPDRLGASRRRPPRRLPRGLPGAVARRPRARPRPVGAAEPRPAHDAGRAGVHRDAPVPGRRHPGGVRRDDRGVQRRLRPRRAAGAATPAGIQVVTLSRGVEEDASFATLAAQQALGAVSRFRAVLAAELVAALRCLRMQGSRPPVLEPASSPGSTSATAAYPTCTTATSPTTS